MSRRRCRNSLLAGSLLTSYLLLACSATADEIRPDNAVPSSGKAENQQVERDGPQDFKTRTLRGQVVWLAEVLARRHGVKLVPEAAERILALKSADGTLYPILEDVRGRAFRTDKRLRGVDLELLVRQHTGSPMIQVIQVFALRKDGKYELDYWCEICAIAMFELKACDCCQADIELRFRKVKRPAAKAERSPAAIRAK